MSENTALSRLDGTLITGSSDGPSSSTAVFASKSQRRRTVVFCWLGVAVACFAASVGGSFIYEATSTDHTADYGMGVTMIAMSMFAGYLAARTAIRTARKTIKGESR